MGKICFIDVETTGLEPFRHETLEVAIVTEERGEPIDEWCSKVSPCRLGLASPVALKLNGFSVEEWAGAPAKEEVALKVRHALRGCTAVGHNVAFDLGFLAALCVEAGIARPAAPHEVLEIEGTVDTVALVREHLFPTGLKSASLDNTRRWLGRDTAGGHRALKDAQDCQRLYGRLLRASIWDRAIWSVLGPRRMRSAA